MRFAIPKQPTGPVVDIKKAKDIIIDFECLGCKTQLKVQAIVDKDAKVAPDTYPYPKNDIFVCPKCNTSNNLAQARLQVEGQLGKKIIIKP